MTRRALSGRPLLKNRQLSGAFNRWAEMTTESLVLERKLHKALGKMMKRRMATCFELWSANVQDIKDSQRKKAAQHRLLARHAGKMKIKVGPGGLIWNTPAASIIPVTV